MGLKDVKKVRERRGRGQPVGKLGATRWPVWEPGPARSQRFSAEELHSRRFCGKSLHFSPLVFLRYYF